MEMAERLNAERDRLLTNFGHFFADFDTNWDAVFAALVWTEEVKGLFEPDFPPIEFVRRASGLEAMEIPSQSRREAFRNRLGQVSLGIQYVTTVFDASASAPGGELTTEAHLPATMAWLEQRLADLVGLQEWLDFKHLKEECDSEGLGGFVAELGRFAPKPEQWPNVFRKRFYQLWLDDRYSKIPELGNSEERTTSP